MHKNVSIAIKYSFKFKVEWNVHTTLSKIVVPIPTPNTHSQHILPTSTSKTYSKNSFSQFLLPPHTPNIYSQHLLQPTSPNTYSQYLLPTPTPNNWLPPPAPNIYSQTTICSTRHARRTGKETRLDGSCSCYISLRQVQQFQNIPFSAWDIPGTGDISKLTPRPG